MKTPLEAGYFGLDFSGTQQYLVAVELGKPLAQGIADLPAPASSRQGSSVAAFFVALAKEDDN
jgi:hypothetical protein